MSLVSGQSPRLPHKGSKSKALWRGRRPSHYHSAFSKQGRGNIPSPARTKERHLLPSRSVIRPPSQGAATGKSRGRSMDAEREAYHGSPTGRRAPGDYEFHVTEAMRWPWNQGVAPVLRAHSGINIKKTAPSRAVYSSPPSPTVAPFSSSASSLSFSSHIHPPAFVLFYPSTNTHFLIPLSSPPSHPSRWLPSSPSSPPRRAPSTTT